RLNQYGGLHVAHKSVDSLGIEIVPAAPVTWLLKMTGPAGGNLQPAEVKDLFLVLGYEWE
ncbi:MAG: hypothetical protein C4293_17755, partial [Nitrospiraceae bacterium]